MQAARPMPDSPADVLALETTVERAGLALACPFSNSDEYEASIIQARRAAGAYAPKRPHLQFWLTIAGSAVILALLATIA